MKIHQARVIYQITGRHLWPWEVDEVVPEDWLSAMMTLTDDVPKYQIKG